MNLPDRLPDLLRGMDDGSIPFTVNERWDDVYAGNVRCYLPDTNTTITIFNDCDSVDYIDSVQRGGQRLRYGQIDHEVVDLLRSLPNLKARLKSAPVTR